METIKFVGMSSSLKIKIKFKSLMFDLHIKNTYHHHQTPIIRRAGVFFESHYKIKEDGYLYLMNKNLAQC